MLENTINNIASGKIFKMGNNPRTAGSMPIWSNVKNETDKTINKLSDINNPISNNVRSYHNSSNNVNNKDNAFGFLDIIDMINPLQHIPIVNDIYRKITGDDIKPISKLIGSSLYAGPLGAGSAIIDIIANQETGQDVRANIKNFIINGEMLPLKSAQKNTISQFVDVKENMNQLPEYALAFVDLKQMPTEIKKPKYSYSNLNN